MMVRLRSLVRNLLRRSRVERELDDELRATLEALIAEKTASGMSAHAARRAALLELGGIESVKNGVRDVRAGALVETLLQDVRYAARLLRRNPLFAATAALSLAIGIGATTTIFTVGNGLLLSTSPGVADPDRLADIVRLEEKGGFGIDPISYPDYLELRRRTTSFDGLFAYQLEAQSASFRVGDRVERAFVHLTTASYFQVLGVPAAAGRVFDATDSDDAGASPIVVLSHRFWTSRFGADPRIVGQTARINGQPMTIAGVAREGFGGVLVVAPDVWVPVGMVAVVRPASGTFPLTSRTSDWLMVGGRLKPGVSRAQASEQVAAIGQALAREFPIAPITYATEDGQKEWRPVFRWRAVAASPVPYGVRLPLAGFLGLLMALVSLVLIIACANVAGVLLARATVRRREIAVRTAMGAGRTRLVRQLLTETTLLFVLGGAAGLTLARVFTSLLVGLLPSFPQQVNLATPLDARVALFSIGLALIASVLSGLAPALHASRADVASVLKDDVQGPSDRLRLRSAFVVAQVAFSVLLVVTAATLIRAFDAEVTRQSGGFDSQDVDIAMVDLTMAGHTDATGPAAARALVDRVRGLPRVTSVTLASQVPGPGGMSFGAVTVPGVAPPRGQTSFMMNWTLVEPEYFETLRIPLLAGRDFTAADRAGSEPVAILGASVASRFWPDASAIGQTFFVDAGSASQRELRVIGVVQDVSFSRQGVSPNNLYVPLQQQHVAAVAMLVRRSPGPTVAGDLRAAIKAVEPDLPVLTAQTLASQQNGPAETQLRIAATVAGSVGIVGLLLAAIGIYGVTAYAVARRTREIGIRLSLGARRGGVVGLVLSEGMKLVAIGAAVGLASSAGVGKLLSGQRFGVQPPDAPILLGVVAVFALVGLAACYVPVRRASRIGAMEALRYE